MQTTSTTHSSVEYTIFPEAIIAMMVLSDRQKDAIKAISFGGLLGLSVKGIPEKLAFHVVDIFDAKSMTLNIGNASLVVDGGLISKLLGIRNTGLSFADVEVAKTLHPSLKAWRARFPPTTYIAPSLISAEIQKDTYSDMAFFRTDFALLFLTTMGSSQQNGYVKDKILKRLTTEKIPRSVVDAWAHVLNGDPKFSIPGMPRRLFCVHTAVVRC
ncbi:hypothetical protein Hanom_Chr07g00626171 [Helianthus anomalus]